MKESSQHGFCLAPATFVLPIVLLLLTPCFARERGPRIEVGCPAPPIPVTIGNHKVLVYELHVTNFDVVPLALKRLEIFAAQESSQPLIIVEDDKLLAAMIRVGAAMVMSSESTEGTQDTRVIDPGGRNVLFVWIELRLDHALPAVLRHRMIFSSTPKGADKPTDATLEDFQVSVSQDSVPILIPPFNGGIWLAGNGPGNDSNHRRSIFAIDGHIYSPERFAVDWIKVGSNGDSHHDGTTKNENWWGWGEPVLAVAEGEITEVVDELPDNTPRVLPPVTLTTSPETTSFFESHQIFLSLTPTCNEEASRFGRVTMFIGETCSRSLAIVATRRVRTCTCK